MPNNLTSEQLKVLQKATEDCPVLQNLKDSIKITVKWKTLRKNAQTFLKFVPPTVFRETPQVSFFDVSVKESNGSDVVIHHGSAISPPNDECFEQYYVHYHQIDHNLVVDGSRTFTLLNPK